MSNKKRNTKGKDSLMRKDEWTISELQMWIHGAYSIQDEDWVPTPEQWAKIVDIIFKLKERQPSASPPPRQAAAPTMPNLPQQIASTGMMGDPHASNFAITDNVNPPLAEAEIPMEANLPLSEIRRRHEAGLLGGAGKPALRTPNIDTSKGYESPF